MARTGEAGSCDHALAIGDQWLQSSMLRHGLESSFVHLVSRSQEANGLSLKVTHGCYPRGPVSLIQEQIIDVLNH